MIALVLALGSDTGMQGLCDAHISGACMRLVKRRLQRSQGQLDPTTRALCRRACADLHDGEACTCDAYTKEREGGAEEHRQATAIWDAQCAMHQDAVACLNRGLSCEEDLKAAKRGEEREAGKRAVHAVPRPVEQCPALQGKSKGAPGPRLTQEEQRCRDFFQRGCDAGGAGDACAKLAGYQERECATDEQIEATLRTGCAQSEEACAALGVFLEDHGAADRALEVYQASCLGDGRFSQTACFNAARLWKRRDSKRALELAAQSCEERGQGVSFRGCNLAGLLSEKLHEGHVVPAEAQGDPLYYYMRGCPRNDGVGGTPNNPRTTTACHNGLRLSFKPDDAVRMQKAKGLAQEACKIAGPKSEECQWEKELAAGRLPL